MLTPFEICVFNARNTRDFAKKSFFIVFVVLLLNFDLVTLKTEKVKCDFFKKQEVKNKKRTCHCAKYTI